MVIPCVFKGREKQFPVAITVPQEPVALTFFLLNSTETRVTHLLRRGHLCSAQHKHAVCGGV